MKFVKSILVVVMLCTIAFSFESCKKKCKNDLPQARIVNNSSSTASVQIKTSDGNTVNINNVGAGTTSDYASYAPGDITFTVTVNKTDYVKTVSVGYCYKYDIAIDGNYNVTSTAIEVKR